MKIRAMTASLMVAVAFLPAAWAQDLPQAVTTQREMVVTANPLATEAGATILQNGGTAVDAMIAVQTVLGLVEPQSSGLGGGAFVVYYDAGSGSLTTIDAREMRRRPRPATGSSTPTATRSASSTPGRAGCRSACPGRRG